ncbi:MAG: acyl carrier protein, partial [Crocinitomicaceae bacterium]
RESVRFTDAVQTALDMTTSVFFEIGPGQSLESAVKRHLTKETEHTACRSMRAETETFNDTTFFTEAIGYLWMNGGMVDWETYYKDQTRNYISLPGYPFERQPYSIDFSASIIGKVVEEAARYEEVKDWYSTPSWKRTGPVQIVENEEVAQTWLLFKDELGLKEQIETQLLEKDHRAITVVFGDKYSKIGENSYMVMMDDRDNYEQLVSDIFADNTTQITHIVDLTDYSKPTALGELDLDAVENASFFSMLYLSQALYTFNKLKTIHLSVVSNGSIEVTGGEVTSPEKSLNVGNCRVLMQEFHDTRAKYIDADLLETTDKRMKTLATNIIAETTSESYEAVVGYRNGHRWKEEFDKVDYVTEQNRQLRENGKYLITGGLGGIGILTAKMISDQVKAEFILTFHSAIPEKSTWNAWLKEQNDDEFIREKIEGVLEIEAKGSTVHLRQINVADFDAMNTMVTEFEAEHGAINGVIHSAGTSGGGIIPLKTAESSRPVLDSKFRGTLVLDKVFDGKELDFMLLYSSITSILGEATRLDYCSANTFLDSYAHYRNARHGDQVAASINWSGWEGLGMSTRWEKRKSAAASITKLRASKEFLKRIHSDDASEIFDVTFSPTNDWIINSHFIVGQPTVVGTTFIELAHQYVQEYHSEKSVELKNLFFMSPLMFENGKHKRTRLFIDKKGGKFKFYYKTQPIDKDPDADIWHDHFMGEMIFMDRKPKSVDLEDIKKRLGSERIDSKSPRVVYNSQNKPLIELGERWDIDNDIYVGESEWLAHLKLRKEFAGDTDFFDYHPAIMDKATSFGLRFISDSTFLPFSYKNVIPYKKLPAEVFAYARVNKAATQGGTVAIDITMISEEGVVLMEIEQYTMKQVNDLPSSAPEKGTKEENAEIVLKELDFIRPDEGEQVLKQILNGVSSSQLIVYPCDFNFMVKDTIPDPLKLQREREKKKEAKKNYYTRPTMETAYEEPETEIEITMAEIWRDILGIDKIGRNDTFAELGGNSLLAIQAIANIADVLEVEITAQVFYENPTIRGLAEAVITSIMDFSEMDDIEGLLAALDEN